MQALTKLDVCSATLWINWCLKDWCGDFCCHCIELLIVNCVWMTMLKRERLNNRSKRKGWPKRKVDYYMNTLMFETLVWRFLLSLYRIIDSELCLDDYVKTREIK